MAELQQEVAWRMGSWQPLEDQGPSSVPAVQDVGINSAIRAGLQVSVAVNWAQPGCSKGAVLPAPGPTSTPPSGGQAVLWLLSPSRLRRMHATPQCPGSNAGITVLNNVSCPFAGSGVWGQGAVQGSAGCRPPVCGQGSRQRQHRKQRGCQPCSAAAAAAERH